jgi:hypothetical protein
MTELFCASFRAWRPDMGQPVVISLGLPRWCADAKGWPVAHVLTPRWSYLKAEPAEFQRCYSEQLERFGVCKIARTLERIAVEHEAEALVLLCHERSWADCHRYQFAQFWMNRTGELVQEIE